MGKALRRPVLGGQAQHLEELAHFVFVDQARGLGALGQRGLRHALGKPLNFVRLMKSAYTFDGGVDYVLWKIERHSGVRMVLTPWQRRHPILASPWVFWQLKKRGAIR